MLTQMTTANCPTNNKRMHRTAATNAVGVSPAFLPRCQRCLARRRVTDLQKLGALPKQTEHEQCSKKQGGERAMLYHEFIFHDPVLLVVRQFMEVSAHDALRTLAPPCWFP